jgi:transcriptional regulator with XRE-family HTH domain
MASALSMHGLNHSSAYVATIVHAPQVSWATMVETTYVERLAIAMGANAGERPEPAAIQALADHLHVSYTAVAKYWADKSKTLTAENNSKAAKFLQVDPDWLATGVGEMRSNRVWPFGTEVTPEQFFALPAESLRPAVDVLRAAIAREQRQEGGPPRLINKTTEQVTPTTQAKKRPRPHRPLMLGPEFQKTNPAKKKASP